MFVYQAILCFFLKKKISLYITFLPQMLCVSIFPPSLENKFCVKESRCEHSNLILSFSHQNRLSSPKCIPGFAKTDAN